MAITWKSLKASLIKDPLDIRMHAAFEKITFNRVFLCKRRRVWTNNISGNFSVPMLDVSAVAGFKAQIPCDIDPVSRSEVVSMVFWYKDERGGEPIYSLDARGKSIAQAKLWSDPYVFGKRATMRTSVEPAKLEIDPLEAADVGVYRCRVDYKNSPTRNQKVNLTVIGEYALPLYFLFLSLILIPVPLIINRD